MGKITVDFVPYGAFTVNYGVTIDINERLDIHVLSIYQEGQGHLKLTLPTTMLQPIAVKIAERISRNPWIAYAAEELPTQEPADAS